MTKAITTYRGAKVGQTAVKTIHRLCRLKHGKRCKHAPERIDIATCVACLKLTAVQVKKLEGRE